jgi:N-methylhydantoinase A/acetophenone carboxylase
MFAYGGAGPTHAAGYARAVRVRRVVTFPQSSVFSAFGISAMAFTRVYERGRRIRLRQPGGRGWLEDFSVFNAIVDELLEESIRDAADVAGNRHAVFRLEVDMRYGMQPNVTRVQAPGLRLADVNDAVALHERFTEEYGRIYSPAALYPQGGVDIEAFALWITIPMGEVVLPDLELAGSDPAAAWKSSRRAWFEDGWRDTPVYEERALRPGNRMDGPAIVEAVDTTTVVPPGWRYTKDRHGNGILEEVR